MGVIFLNELAMEKQEDKIKRSMVRMIIAFAIMTVAFSCSKSSNTDNSGNPPGSGSPGPNEVWMKDIAFNPSTITVTAGTTIKWINKDPVSHTVTSDDGLFDSGTIASGGTYTHQFDNAGTYPYKCTIHQGMTGTVVVN